MEDIQIYPFGTYRFVVTKNNIIIHVSGFDNVRVGDDVRVGDKMTIYSSLPLEYYLTASLRVKEDNPGIMKYIEEKFKVKYPEYFIWKD